MNSFTSFRKYSYNKIIGNRNSFLRVRILSVLLKDPWVLSLGLQRNEKVYTRNTVVITVPYPPILFSF